MTFFKSRLFKFEEVCFSPLVRIRSDTDVLDRLDRPDVLDRSNRYSNGFSDCTLLESPETKLVGDHERERVDEEGRKTQHECSGVIYTRRSAADLMPCNSIDADSPTRRRGKEEKKTKHRIV